MKPITVSFLLALSLASPSTAPAGPIPAQPIGSLARRAASSDPNDFFVIHGPARGSTVNKIFFNAKVRDLPGGKQLRRWYVQQVEPSNDPTVRNFLINRQAPAQPLSTFVLPAGAKVDSFIPTDDLGDAPRGRPRYERMFFRVPGAGIFSTTGGANPVRLRLESARDATKAIIGPAIRLSDFIFDNVDQELRGRLFFSAVDARGGREPFISAGTPRSTKVLANIYPGRRVGSDCGGFAVLGPQNETQRVFFSANNPDDSDSAQLWQVTTTVSGRRLTYGVAPFTTGANALPGAPTQLLANGSDLFFAAPIVAGGVPELWHLEGGGNIDDLDSITTGGRDPRNLTFTTVDTSYSELVMTVLASGVRRYARWNDFSDTVTVLDGAAVGGLSDPQLITDAGQYFYFAADFDGDATHETYLIKHATADNSLDYVNLGTSGETTIYPFNIGEICAVSSDGTAGVLYFTADGFVDGTLQEDVLFKLPANDTSYTAVPVRTAGSALVKGARNLRAVISAGGVGMFRLYFGAPINSTQNSSFLPPNSTDEGIEPWVTEE